MTHEQRLDRLERIVRLMIRAGLKARRQSREQDEKINILIDGQIKNDELFAALAQAQAGLTQAQTGFAAAQTRLAEAQTRLAEGQAENDDRLNTLINTVERYLAGRDGGA